MMMFFNSLHVKGRLYSPIYHIYFIGESNSGGYALNSDALASELDIDPNIKIWDNINNDGFENLDIGTNNLLGHTGLSNGTTHGWELQLQSKAESLDSPIYLTKCGQGGSVISQWDLNGSYYQSFITRATGSKSAITQSNLKTCVVISFGINDAIAGTNVNTWYSETLSWIESVKNETNADIIVITDLMENTSEKIAINAQIDNLVSALPYLEKSLTAGATLRDSNHWDYNGMKLICNRIWDIIK